MTTWFNLVRVFPCAEVEETLRSSIQGFNQSKEDFVKDVCDDVIFLPPDAPIIKGKQGKTTCNLVIVI